MSADDKVTLTIVRVQKLGKQVGQITPALIFADVTDISNPWTLPPPPTLPGKVIVWGELATNVQDFDLVQTQDFPGGFSGSRGSLSWDENSCYCFVLAGTWGEQSDCVLIRVRRTNYLKMTKCVSSFSPPLHLPAATIIPL